MSATPAPAGRTLLEVNDLKKHFSLGGGLFGRSTRVLKAVDAMQADMTAVGTAAQGAPAYNNARCYR